MLKDLTARMNETCICRGYTCGKGNNWGDSSDGFVSNGTVCENS